MTITTLKMSDFLEHFFAAAKPEWWESVYSDYISRRENANSQYILDLMKEVAFLENKYYITAKCIEVLSMGYSDTLAKELRQQGMRGRFNPENPAQYKADLQGAISASKRLLGQITRKMKELTDYQAQYGGKEIKYKDFQDWNVSLEKFMGFQIHFDQVTVDKWLTYLNKYEAYCEVKNAESNNMLKQDRYGR